MEKNKDYLTGLLGTGEFIHECERIVEEGNRKLVLINNDISNFKYVNNLYSMEEGDKLISEIAHFFYIDNPSCLAACRPGCDQFRGIFDMTGRTKEEELARIEEMNSRFEERMAERYPNIYIHVYTGVYFLEDDETNVRIALDKAHMAKKLAKGKFDIKYLVYNPSDFEMQTEQMEMMNLFIKACDTNGILLYLQPKFSVSKDCVVGAEALVRLDDGNGNIIMPGRFIPVLETTGTISKLDEIMIEKVFALQRKWLDEGTGNIPVSVNVSPITFGKENFAEFVLGVQRKYDVPARLVELEVLESTVIDAEESVYQVINLLRDNGFKISVDDFGSGYSCLNQIASIPADIIKLDRVFAFRGLKNDKGKRVVKALIQMLHEIEYSVVFEGIETQEERDLAYSFGCDVIQGYFYSKPVPVDEFETNIL